MLANFRDNVKHFQGRSKSFLVICRDPKDIQERFPRAENESGTQMGALSGCQNWGKEHGVRASIRKESEGRESIRVKQADLMFDWKLSPTLLDLKWVANCSLGELLLSPLHVSSM